MPLAPVDGATLTQGLEVTIHGRPGRVDLAVYVQTLTQLRLALAELDRRLRPEGGGAARWGVRHIPYDAGLRDLLTPAKIPRRRHSDDLQLPPRTLVHGVAELLQQPGLPDAFTPTLVERLQEVGERVGESGIEGVLLASVNGDRSEPTPITPEVLANAGAAVREVTRAHGSVEGVLDLLSARRGRRRASVYNSRTRRAVTVHFGDDLAQLVRQLFEQQVVAEGQLARNAQGQPVSLQLQHLEPLPPSATQSVASLLGVAPDWLSGRTTEEYLDMARRRA